MRLRSRREGFTLIELMISVAIIGILAAIAIPNFILYQQRSKRSEAYTNLDGIRKVELAYFTEFGSYVTAKTSPQCSPLSSDKQNWPVLDDRRFSTDAPNSGFEAIGWVPEGETYFDYDVNAQVLPGGAVFTAGAYGDVDGDGLVAQFMYMSSPDNGTSWVPCYQCPGGVAPLGGLWGNPPRAPDGSDVFNSVMAVLPPDSDDF